MGVVQTENEVAQPRTRLRERMRRFMKGRGTTRTDSSQSSGHTNPNENLRDSSSRDGMELEVLAPPPDVQALLDDLEKAGLRPIKNNGGPGLNDCGISRGRARQLEGACVVLYLRQTKGFHRAGLCHISDEDYDQLQSEAAKWAEDFEGKHIENGSQMPAGTILHIVTPNDTIQGLAIRYDTTVSRLRELNRLPMGRDMFERKEMIVPMGADTSSGMPHVNNPNVTEFRHLARHEAMSHFKKRLECTENEAWCYLEFNDYDVAKAEAEYTEDLKWDQQPESTSPETVTTSTATGSVVSVV